MGSVARRLGSTKTCRKSNKITALELTIIKKDPNLRTPAKVQSKLYQTTSNFRAIEKTTARLIALCLAFVQPVPGL